MNRGIHSFAFALVAVLAFSACTYQPAHGDALYGTDQTQFIGFATAASLTIRIEGLNPATNAWVYVTQTTADATAYAISAPSFSRPLYQWSKEFTVPSYLFSGNQVTLRARQLTGSSYVDTYMYDQAGWQCLVNRFFAAGTGVLDVEKAGSECSDGRFQITLHR